MEGRLIFKLPEDQVEFNLATKAGALSCVITELARYLREMDKYQNLDTLPIDSVRGKLYSLIDEYDLSETINS